MRIEFNSDSESSEGLRTIIYICERALADREARTVPKDPPQWTAEERERYAKAATRGTLFGGTMRENLVQTAAARAIVDAAASGHPVIDEATGEPLSEREIEALQRIADGTGAEAARKAFGANPQLPPVPPVNTATAPAGSTANGISAPADAPTGSPIAPPAGAAANNPTTAASSDVERDKSGIPWDERIHSRERTKNKDGSWRDKRGVDAAVKTAVLAEIAGTVTPVEPPVPRVPTPPSPPAPSVPVPPSNVVSLRPGVPVPPENAGVPNPPQPVVVPQPPVNPTANGQAQSSATAVSSAAAGASPSKLTFPALVSKINQGLAGSKITQDDIQLACSELGIAGVAALADPANAHLTDAVAAKLFPQG
jgi:hypothetical protein